MYFSVFRSEVNWEAEKEKVLFAPEDDNIVTGRHCELRFGFWGRLTVFLLLLVQNLKSIHSLMTKSYTARVTSKVTCYLIELCQEGIRFRWFLASTSDANSSQEKSFAVGVVNTFSYHALSFPALRDEVFFDGVRNVEILCFSASNSWEEEEEMYIRLLFVKTGVTPLKSTTILQMEL